MLKKSLVALAAVALGMLAFGADKGKIRVFIPDSSSWAVSGGLAGGDDITFGGSTGGARPQTAEIVKTFNERCPEVTVTMLKEKADYIVLLEHEGGKSLIRKDNKVVVFTREGDAFYSGSTVTLGNAVKDACQAILSEEEDRQVTREP